MNTTILLWSWILVQLGNTDTIREPRAVPVDPQSVESQLRMYVYLSKFVEICRPHIRINRVVVDVEVVKLRSDAMSRKDVLPEMYDEAAKVESDIRVLAIKMVGEKTWCETNKFVLTAHGYGRMFKEQQEQSEQK